MRILEIKFLTKKEVLVEETFHVSLRDNEADFIAIQEADRGQCIKTDILSTKTIQRQLIEKNNV